jgi:hypothetical protein
MRKIGSPSRRGSVVEGTPFAYSEALPPGVTEAQLQLLSQEDEKQKEPPLVIDHRQTIIL